MPEDMLLIKYTDQYFRNLSNYQFEILKNSKQQNFFIDINSEGVGKEFYKYVSFYLQIVKHM